MTIEELRSDLCRSVERRGKRLIELSRAIHANPELAFEEFTSSRLIAEAASEAGLEVRKEAYGLETALATEFGEGSAVVGILSEYDALPNIGHACGHNVIAAAGLGAAMALHDLGDRLPGRVRWLGTPAEERGCGKEIMARHGAFDGLCAAMMVHPAGVDAKSVRTSCIAQVEVEFTGRAAHAAVNAHGGLNAVDAAVGAYQALAALRQHLPPGDMFNGIISNGGAAPNIVPDKASLTYFVRSPDSRRLAALKKRFETAMRAGALGAGCEVEIRWARADYLNYKGNAPLADTYMMYAKALGREFFPVEQLPVGGTDMGNVSHRVPALHPLISAAPMNVFIHDAEFARWAASQMGDEAVIDGAKALAMTALDVLADEKLRMRIYEDFERSGDESRHAVASSWRQDDSEVRHASAGCC